MSARHDTDETAYEMFEAFCQAAISASPQPLKDLGEYAVASVEGPFPVCTILHRHDGLTDFMGRNV